MQEKTMRSFSPEEEKKVLALRTLGLSRIEARLAVYLAMPHDKIDRRTVEMEADLRQPEVSIGLKRLRSRGDLEGYTLKTGLGEIALRLCTKQMARLNEALAIIGDEKQC
jgi:predicted transcriptional regulator